MASPDGSAKGVMCDICLETATEVLRCPESKCTYKVCKKCTSEAMKDGHGHCPACQHPIFSHMFEKLFGKMALRSFETEMKVSVRSEIESSREKETKLEFQESSTDKEKARRLFNELAEALCMRCPECKQVFHDYEGCNALTCPNTNCGIGFCAVCLEPCGTDAHEHVRKKHGDLFDKDAFEQARDERNKATVKRFISTRLQDSTPAVRRLLRKFEKKMFGQNTVKDLKDVSSFISISREEIQKSIRTERKSIIQRRGRYSSLRNNCQVPESYRMYFHEGKLWIEHATDPFQVPPYDPKLTRDEIRKDEQLNQLYSGFICAAVVFEETKWRIFQTSSTCIQKGRGLVHETRLTSVDEGTGELLHEHTPYGRLRVIGVLPNARQMQLWNRVARLKPDQLQKPIVDYIGASRTTPLLDDFPSTPMEKCSQNLNSDQVRVADPLEWESANEVAGPPGTGKTTVIVELIHQMLQHTEASIVILSERNGAIDAVADKLASKALDSKLEVKHLQLWKAVLAFGSKSAVGAKTQQFMLNSKLCRHPELKKLRNSVSVLNDRLKSFRTKASRAFSEILRELGKSETFDELDEAIRMIENHIQMPKEKKQSKLTPAKLKDRYGTISNTCKKFGMILPDVGTMTASTSKSKMLQQINKSLYKALPYLRKKKEKLEDDDSKHYRSFLQSLVSNDRLSTLLNAMENRANSDGQQLLGKLLNTFDAKKIQILERDLETTLSLLREREIDVPDELVEQARVLICTIGSSHLLWKARNKLKSDRESFNDSPIIVVFDEAGTIPAYELCGLGENETIQSLFVIGDKNQLKPYCSDFKTGPPRSLLDVSDVESKKLRVQYRVPKPVAEILNEVLYHGDFNTASGMRCDNKGGYTFIDVTSRNVERYVNKAEISEIKRILVDQKNIDLNIKDSLLILTPYKNQQKEIEKQRELLDLNSNVPIMTIDQAQGQEADFVILSLVQTPTRFLDSNRLCVAISRMRRHLFILGDASGIRRRFNLNQQITGSDNKIQKITSKPGQIFGKLLRR